MRAIDSDPVRRLAASSHDGLMSTNTYPTRFDSVLDLSRLTWFEVKSGNRLVLADGAAEEIGPLVYNRAVADVQERLQARILELDIDVHEDEVTYWRKY